MWSLGHEPQPGLAAKVNEETYKPFNLFSNSDMFYTMLSEMYLSYDIASGSEITLCINIDKPLQIFGKCYDVHNNDALQ